MIPEFNSAVDFIRNPELLNRNTIPVLQEAIRQNPYHQTLYLLLLQNMYKVHDPQFSSTLKQYALMVADRSVLFEMVEGINYNVPIQKLEEDNPVSSGDRTLWLIDNFLNNLPESNAIQPDKIDAVDPQKDYSAYLEQLPDYEDATVIKPTVEIANESTSVGHAESSAEADIEFHADTVTENETESAVESATDRAVEIPLPPAAVVKVAKEATAEEPAIVSDGPEEDEEFTVTAIRRHLNEADDELLPDDIVDDDSDAPKEDFYTETMAGIYIKQHKFEQALEIIKAISAANPKKSVYFAEQIRYLELLVRLGRNKKTLKN